MLVDDHSLIRVGIMSMLHTNPDVQMVAEFNSGKDVLQFLVENKDIDMIIMDLSLQDMTGIELMENLPYSMKVIVISMHKDFRYIKKAIQLGALAYIVKDDFSNELTKAIKEVIKGNNYLSEQAISSLDVDMLSHIESPKISSRENEVLHLLTQGLSSKMIGDKLNISVSTVDVHRSNLLKKLDCKNTAELIKYSLSVRTDL